MLQGLVYCTGVGHQHAFLSGFMPVALAIGAMAEDPSVVQAQAITPRLCAASICAR